MMGVIEEHARLARPGEGLTSAESHRSHTARNQLVEQLHSELEIERVEVVLRHAERAGHVALWL